MKLFVLYGLLCDLFFDWLLNWLFPVTEASSLQARTPTAGEHEVCYVKAGHCYVFFFTDETRQEAMRHVGRMAAEPANNLTWVDVSRITMAIRTIGDQVHVSV